MTDLDVRRYEPGDADAVWDLHVRALDDVGAFDEAYAHLDADLRNVREAYLEPGGAFHVGEIGDEIVAMGAVQPSAAVDHHETDPATGVVRRMRVDPDRQREGHGRQILRALESRAAELGFERLVLDTTTRQQAAIGLYESAGFRETHRETVGAIDAEMVFFEKDL